MKIRIAGLTKESFVDGPGIRYVIFTQGCPHNCRGCHNPQTHSLDEGELVEADDIIKDVLNYSHIDGVTLSGGEPFLQPQSVEYLLGKLKEKGINIICYTGYTYEQIIGDCEKSRLLKYIDILIDGPFVMKEKDLSLSFRGSRNQRVIDVPRSIASGKVGIIDFKRW